MQRPDLTMPVDVPGRTASGPSDWRQLLPWLAAVTGMAIVIACFYPGQMNSDSLSQLTQARTGLYDDWHPPGMSWCWRQTDRVIPGPLGMLLFHNLLFWSGLALILRERLAPLPAAVVTLLIGLSPSCFALLGTIWKDVGLGVSLLAAAALITRFDRTRSRLLLVPAATLLFYACLVRKNAASAVVPVAIWAGICWAGTGAAPARRWLGVAAGTVAALAMFWGGLRVNAYLTGPRLTFQAQAIFLHDLTAISLARREVILPDYLKEGREAPGLRDLETSFSSRNLDPLLFGDKARLSLTARETEYRQLARLWREELLLNPGIYLRHRLAVFMATLGLTRELEYPFHWGINDNKFGYRMRDSRLFNRAMRVLYALHDSIFFRGGFFVALGVLAVGVAFRRGVNRRLTLALVASGLAYVAPYFLISPAGIFRYTWWMAIASLLALALALAPRNGRPVPVPPSR